MRVSRAIGTLFPVIEQFDRVNNVPHVSGAHTKPKSDKDRNMLLEEIGKTVRVFRFKSGRKHRSFPHIKPLLQHKSKRLVHWMKGHIANLARYEQ